MELKTLDEMSRTEEQDEYQDIFGDSDSDSEEEELKPIGTASSLFTKTVAGDPEKDIGECTTSYNDGSQKSLH